VGGADTHVASIFKDELHGIIAQKITVAKTLKRIRVLVFYYKNTLVHFLTTEKPPVTQPLKNFPAFYGTRRFITMFTRALHWSLS
jgi:hypothetical protein